MYMPNSYAIIGTKTVGVTTKGYISTRRPRWAGGHTATLRTSLSVRILQDHGVLKSVILNCHVTIAAHIDYWRITVFEVFIIGKVIIAKVNVGPTL